MRAINSILTLTIVVLLTSTGIVVEAASGVEWKSVLIPLPQGTPGIGFDDLFYAPTLKRILAPAGRTGSLDLIDPTNNSISEIRGFNVQDSYSGGHADSVTSADEGAGFLFATDRTSKSVKMINSRTKKIIASADLRASPDYVRFVASTNEIWVTEPEAEQIEILSLQTQVPVKMESKVIIKIVGGPESLIIHSSQKKAYSHLWKGQSVEIDIKSRKITNTWKNDCVGSRGIALNEKHGFLFAGCSEGKAVVLDINHDGKILSKLQTGAGVDIISYNSRLSHLYVPAAKTQKLEVLAVSSTGELTKIVTGKIALQSHCVASDGRKGIWVCDPSHGQLIYFEDSGVAK
ncbi:MAG: repeat protein [Bacteriovoracaceae bacterium]|nr:repeat protein [Bacteriovoracaceae bacterium]